MQTIAARYLELLAAHGVTRLFVNSGTDFAPLVEAYASTDGPVPDPLVCAHESVAVGMAHGAYQASGRLQAVMFHVTVGTANAICAITNAARDNVPLLVAAGRTPVLEAGALGARDTHIHWAQEMFDQAGMVRELVKWDYELRDPSQLDAVIDRAVAIATTHPRGPVYLTLPRELLAREAVASPMTIGTSVPAAPRPDGGDVGRLADRLADAEFPVIAASAAGADPSAVAALTSLADRFAIGLAEVVPRYLNVPADHPLHLGHRIEAVLADADVVVFAEADVPWMQRWTNPQPSTFIAQVGLDPLFARYPMRSHRSDLTLLGTPTDVFTTLADALADRAERIDPDRRARLTARAREVAATTARLRASEAATDGPITKAFLSATVGEVLDGDAAVFNEYWGVPELLGRTEPGTFYAHPPAGGLGWAIPAAMGARLESDRLAVALVGDGTYLFSNPAACHHAAAKHDTPILTIVADNGRWGAVEHATRAVYPEGRAVADGERRLSDLSPSPAYEAYGQASGGHGERVTTRTELRPALERAIDAVKHGRQALLNVACI